MILNVEKVRFGYRRGNDILRELSFSIDTGDGLCILGPNGTGKTTLLRCLLGINKDYGGKIKVRERDVRSYAARELAKELSYVPQAVSVVSPHKVLDMVVMGRSPHLKPLSQPSARDVRIARQALDNAGILHLEDRYFNEISGGERQMVLIARALTQQSKIMIMDEPTSSLDYGNQVRILIIVNELLKQGYSIVMTSHFPGHAFLAGNTVALMKGGRFVSTGSPDDIVTGSSLSYLYDTPINVVVTQPADAGREPVKVCVPVLS